MKKTVINNETIDDDGRRTIAEELYLSVKRSAEFLGCCRTTMDKLLNLARKGHLHPSISWYRDTPRSPIWIKKSDLENLARQRGEMHT